MSDFEKEVAERMLLFSRQAIVRSRNIVLCVPRWGQNILTIFSGRAAPLFSTLKTLCYAGTDLVNKTRPYHWNRHCPRPDRSFFSASMLHYWICVMPLARRKAYPKIFTRKCWASTSISAHITVPLRGSSYGIAHSDDQVPSIAPDITISKRRCRELFTCTGLPRQ